MQRRRNEGPRRENVSISSAQSDEALRSNLKRAFPLPVDDQLEDTLFARLLDTLSRAKNQKL